ncbi:MAG: hypothetical protein J1F38_00145 [Muribaculaceae bacterium]|nr:hypothetical protein [Muribaculaceae bacterium]
MSRRFINFARLFFCISIFALFSLATFSACKGRTAENMVPTGDTVEVVIMQNNIAEIDSIQ